MVLRGQWIYRQAPGTDVRGPCVWGAVPALMPWGAMFGTQHCQNAAAGHEDEGDCRRGDKLWIDEPGPNHHADDDEIGRYSSQKNEHYAYSPTVDASCMIPR